MYVRFWGTRGSIATPGPGTARYGGNTACTEVRADDGTLIVLDCGTGARELGLKLLQERPVKTHILITHTHWDHIQGFPFFTPAFLPDSEITVYAPTGFALNLANALSGQMQYSYFPVKLEDLHSRLRLVDVEEGVFTIGSLTLETQFLNHTAPTIGYRISSGGVTVVYATDHEPYTIPSGTLVHPGDHRHTAFLDRADLVIHDAQYSEDEYPSRLGWGHSTVTYATDVAMEAGAKRLALFHHEPTHDDPAVERLEAACQARALTRRSNLEVFAAAEGMEIYLPERSELNTPVFARSALDRRPVSGGRLVIVSENEAHSGPIVDVVQQEGMEAWVAQGETQMRDLILRSAPSAIVLDASTLGEQRAMALAGELSADFRSLDAALILLSPSLGDDLIRRAHAAGIKDCLSIPFSPPMLAARVKAWLTRYHRADHAPPNVRSGPRPSLPLPPPPPEGGQVPTEPRTGSSKTAVLAATHLFGALSEDELKDLAGRARQHTYGPGEVVAQQGVGGRVLYVIAAGRVRVVGRSPDVQAGEVLLDELGPGDIFGELSSLDDLPHSATVRTVTRTRCLAIQRSDLLRIMERSPAFNLRLLRTLTHRLRRADRLLVRGGPDALTGLPTRQTVEEHYKREVAATRRRRYHLAILLVDIDDLKAINEEHGPVVGDEVLRALSDALRSATRESDIVGRLGGDNFVAILPDAGVDGARLVAGRITRILEGLVAHRDLQANPACSIRMAASQDPPGTLDEWLREIDKNPVRWRQRASS